MSASIVVGEIQLTLVSGGQLRLDGGNMFGVVPRDMWAKKSPPDEHNRILLDTNCILVRTSSSLGLVDTGYGGKAPAKVRSHYALEDGMPLAKNLEGIGIGPDEIDWVILTHLHFDHAGGATFIDADGHLRPMFPRARHIIQRNEWDDAIGNLPELAGSYFPDDFASLEQCGLVDLVDGHVEVTSGISTRLTGGHTRGHQIVCFKWGNDSAICPGDICPTSAHLPTFWTMAYDQFLLDVRRIKPLVLNEIVDNRRIALFSHDPKIWAAKLSRADGEIVPIPLSP